MKIRWKTIQYGYIREWKPCLLNVTVDESCVLLARTIQVCIKAQIWRECRKNPNKNWLKVASRMALLRVIMRDLRCMAISSRPKSAVVTSWKISHYVHSFPCAPSKSPTETDNPIFSVSQGQHNPYTPAYVWIRPPQSSFSEMAMHSDFYGYVGNLKRPLFATHTLPSCYYLRIYI